MTDVHPKRAIDDLDRAELKPTVDLIDGFLQRAIWLLALVAIPTAVASVSRAHIVGWRPLFAVHLVSLILVWMMVLLRRRLSLRIRAVVFSGLAFALGVSGLLQFGQLGQGLLILGIACMLAATIFGLRTGLAAVVVCALSVTAILLAFGRGVLAIDFDISTYLRSPAVLGSAVLGFVLIGGGGVALAGAIRDELGNSLERLQDRTLELECAIDALNQEIRERRLTEEVLRASEARFQSVFNQAAIGIGVQSTEGIWLQANERACGMFGYSVDELVGLSLFDLTHPDDLDKSRAGLRRMADGEAERVTMEKRYIHRDGSVIWAKTYASLVRDNEGRPIFHVVAIEDVTDRRKVEEEKRQFYRQTISSVTDGKLQIAADNESRMYEEGCAVRLRIESPEEVGQVRQRIRDYCELRGLGGEALEMLIVGLGEALGNALKHARGGDVFAGTECDKVWVGVSDKGEGIATFALPGATLRRGSSTKLSMGFGYSIMMNVADQVVLTTGREGTRVVLIKKIGEAEPGLRLEDLRDTWDSI